MIRTMRATYSAIMLLLAFVLFMIMESSTYQINPDLRVVAEAVYHVGMVVAAGMAGLPWAVSQPGTKSG